jgi:segregation and condensation protein A
VSGPDAAPPVAATPTTLAGYQLRLPTFEGPLDVLLRLVERDQLAISEVSLVAVTDQFLDYLAGIDAAPPETIAEFAAVGARLVLLKSRSLLPRPPETMEQEPDPSDLVRQLSEYQRIREAARHLADRDRLGAGAFERGTGAAPPAPVGLAPLAPHQPSSLVRAIRRRLTTLAPRAQSIVTAPVITLREMVERVLTAIGSGREATFRSLVRDGADRHEALTAFLAVLVLVRRRAVEARQSELFGPILISSATTAVEDTDHLNGTGEEVAADD